MLTKTHEMLVSELNREIERLIVVRDYHLSKSTTHSATLKLDRTDLEANSNTESNNYTPKHELAAKILRTHGKPLNTSAIVAKAKEIGFCSRATLETAVAAMFFTAMSRHKELFCKHERGKWSLVEWSNA